MLRILPGKNCTFRAGVKGGQAVSVHRVLGG